MPITALRLPLALMVVLVTFLALTPGPSGQVIESGPVRHMLAFAGLAVLSSLAWPLVKPLWHFLTFAAFGAAIEIAQLLMNAGRLAEWEDWVNDLTATAAALLLVSAWRTWSARASGLEPR